MKISAEEIKKIALLSRLEVKEDQMETVGKQLNDILSYMDLLSQVDVANEKALQNAPEQADGYFKVPKVIQD